MIYFYRIPLTDLSTKQSHFESLYFIERCT